MKTGINILLGILVIALIWMLVGSINEPIKFEQAKNERETAVKERLMQIRTAQEMYLGMTDSFAPSFEVLQSTLNNGKIAILNEVGDVEDPANFRVDTTWVSTVDSLNSLDVNIDSLSHVPYSSNKVFEMHSGLIEQQGIDVPVLEVRTNYVNFMGPYADSRFALYDARYSPNNDLRIGDLNSPSLSGNW